MPDRSPALAAVRTELLAAERERDDAHALLRQRMTTALTAFAAALVPRAEQEALGRAAEFLRGTSAEKAFSLGWLEARRRQLGADLGNVPPEVLAEGIAAAEAERDALLARIAARRSELGAGDDPAVAAAHVEDLQALRMIASRLARLSRALKRRSEGEAGLRLLEDEVVDRVRAAIVDAALVWLRSPATARDFDVRVGAIAHDVRADAVVHAARVLGFAVRCLEGAWDAFLAKSAAALQIAVLTGELAADVWGELLLGRERYGAMARAACAFVIEHTDGGGGNRFALVFGAALPALGPFADGLFLPEVRTLGDEAEPTWVAQSPTTEPLGPRPLLRLGRYRLDRLLARGGMGEVYDATKDGPRGFTKRVIVKRILAEHAGDPYFIELFKREAALVSRLQHPNIIVVDELGVEGDVWFMALEWLDGASLQRLLARRPALDVLARIFVDAASGLAFAHDAGVVHRDISPDNLFVSRAGVTKVIDFGIASDVDAAVDERLRGKLPFMAPELFRGVTASPVVDVFALGVTLWEALVGQRPFVGPTPQALVQAICFKNAVPPSLHVAGVPAPLDSLVMAMLEKQPERRPSAREVASALRTFASPPLRLQQFMEREEMLPST